MTVTTGAPSLVICQGCGAPLEQPATGRPREWCSNVCRERERRYNIQQLSLTDKPGKPMSPQHAAWVARKRRERMGLPLRPRDRQQITEQLEDL